MGIPDVRKKHAAWKFLVGLSGFLLILSACTGDGGGPGRAVPAPKLRIEPATGDQRVRPDKPVVVSAQHGKLGKVEVRSRGRDVPGTWNAQRTEWRTTWPLDPDARYSVRALAENSEGETVRENRGFRTLKPNNTFKAEFDWILDLDYDSYGVGLPISVTFDRPVKNKAAVEKAFEVKAEKPVPGAWRWIDDEWVVYRTKRFWPAHQKVKFKAHLSGVRSAKGVYGTEDLSRTFEIGEARISTVDLKKKHMKVKVDGKVVRRYGISGGDGSDIEYTTPSGTALTMTKSEVEIMENPDAAPGTAGYYSVPIPLAVRVTNSGIFLHQTAGEEWCLGSENCSHGCVRQPADAARWFFDKARPGDVVITKGTDRPMHWNDGWTFYQMPWKKWKRGSALDRAAAPETLAAGNAAGRR